MERRAKIVATLGPASVAEDVLARMFAAGVDVVRLNMSHGDHAMHRRVIRRVRQQAKAAGLFVTVIVDLMGPRFRLGAIDGGIELAAGDAVRLGAADADHGGEGTYLPVEAPAFLDHLRAGERLLIADGLVELRIVGRDDRTFRAEVVHGGVVTTAKGLNLPDTDLPFTISEKDRQDIAFAVREGADFLAVSFVGEAEDLDAVRTVAEAAGGVLPLIAKLERVKAIGRLDELVQRADAIMVARGDLGVEAPLDEVPVLQKRIVQAGRRYAKSVIVATQMLESMISQARPTRAEASDVANAVFDGADALMLSGETAIGDNPVKVVETMAAIICQAEAYQLEKAPPTTDETLTPTPGISEQQQLNPERDVHLEIPDVVCAAAVYTAQRLDLRHIVAFSQGGFTARMIARYRPRVPITVFTRDPRVARRVQLVWGARPLLMEVKVRHHDEVVKIVDRLLLAADAARPGDVLAVLMGDPVNEKPLTNLLRIHRVRPG